MISTTTETTATGKPMTANAIIKSEKNGIVTLTFDLPGEKVNKLSTPVMQELKSHIESLKNSSAKFVIFKLLRLHLPY